MIELGRLKEEDGKGKMERRRWQEEDGKRKIERDWGTTEGTRKEKGR